MTVTKLLPGEVLADDFFDFIEKWKSFLFWSGSLVDLLSITLVSSEEALVIFF